MTGILAGGIEDKLIIKILYFLWSGWRYDIDCNYSPTACKDIKNSILFFGKNKILNFVLKQNFLMCLSFWGNDGIF